MFRNRYKLFDFKQDPRASYGALLVTPFEARRANFDGYGVFYTPNDFDGPRRIQNLVKLNCWWVDIDSESKDDQWRRIQSGPIPSWTVETKRGYQVYFWAKDASLKNWNAIMKDRLVPFYAGDPNACDPARILRYPGYLHQKDPKNPFLVSIVQDASVQYSEAQMLSLFKPKEEKKSSYTKKSKSFVSKDASVWDKIFALDCGEALLTLSGTDAVCGERYELKRQHSGTFNIYVDNLGTSCWVDNDGLIGSHDHGGPTIAHWINWHHKNWGKTWEIMKKYFPKVFENQTGDNHESLKKSGSGGQT